MINRALLEKEYPGGQLLRNTGANWDNADRRTPYTDQVTVGYERQLAGNMAVSADYVHAFSRDLLMCAGPQPGPARRRPTRRRRWSGRGARR